MSAEKILLKICDIPIGELSTPLEYVLKNAFNEQNHIKLLKKRALLCEHCYYVLNDIGYKKDTLDDILGVVADRNLTTTMDAFKHVTSNAQKNLVKSVFAHYNLKNKYENEPDMHEIADIAQDLRNDIRSAGFDKEQERLMLGFCELVEEAKEESEILGNLAVRKLHAAFIGRLAIYQDRLESIKNHKVFDKLKWLYAKIRAINAFVKTIKEFYENITLLS